jgi:hypothetical protein
MSQKTTQSSAEPQKQHEQPKPNFQPEQAEPTYSEGGKFGRQEGQIGSKGPAVGKPARPIGPIPQDIKGRHPHDKTQTDGGSPEEHPKAS